MSEVARVAGVSPQTVSRTLRGYVHVSAATRAKVLAAVEEVGYRRNQAAASLASAKQESIGVLSLHEGSFRFSVTTGIIREADAAGYTITMGITSSEQPTHVADAVSRLLNQSVAGLILLLSLNDTDERLDKLLSLVPSIAVLGDRPQWADAIAIDERAATRLEVEHLLSLGHDTVWYVSGTDAALRQAGWRDALEAAGRRIPPVSNGDWTPQSGYRIGLKLARTPGVTAIAVADDDMAFGVMRALQDSGLRVPDDVSVVGFDDVLLADFAAPGLTSVRHPYDEMGARAARYVLHALKGSAEPFASPPLVPELVLRKSTASPRRAV